MTYGILWKPLSVQNYKLGFLLHFPLFISYIFSPHLLFFCMLLFFFLTRLCLVYSKKPKYVNRNIYVSFWSEMNNHSLRAWRSWHVFKAHVFDLMLSTVWPLCFKMVITKSLCLVSFMFSFWIHIFVLRLTPLLQNTLSVSSDLVWDKHLYLCLYFCATDSIFQSWLFICFQSLGTIRFNTFLGWLPWCTLVSWSAEK